MVEHKRLNDALQEYLRYRAVRLAETTAKNEAFVLRRFVSWYGNVQIRHMKSDRTAEWFYGRNGLMLPHRTRDGVHRPAITASTHNYYRTRLASLFRFCTKRCWLRVDLLSEVPPMPVQRRVRLQPGPEALLAMLDLAQNPRDRALIATITNTGFRSREVTNLRVGSVDLDAGWLTVTIFKTHEEDLFPITAELDRELRTWLHIYARDLGRPLGADDYLFPSRIGPRYVWTIGPDGIKVCQQTPPSWQPGKAVTRTERIVQDALAALGYEVKGEGVHTVRRGVARILFDAQANDTGYDAALRTVSATLHHKSTATTELYLGLSSERQRRDDRLRGKPFLSTLVASASILPLTRRTSGE